MTKPEGPYREPMQTLTEDDFKDQCARPTVRPPVPIEEMVQKLMRESDGDAAAPIAPAAPVAPEIPKPPRAPEKRRDDFDDLQLDSLEATVEAELLSEIGEAYLDKLGKRADVPYLLMPLEKAMHMQLDHWAGFLLSMVDGRTSIGDIIDASSMPEVEALRVLDELRERGLIGVRLRPPPRITGR